MRFGSAAQADSAIETLNGVVIDSGHTFVAERTEDSRVWSEAVARGEIDEVIVGEIEEVVVREIDELGA